MSGSRKKPSKRGVRGVKEAKAKPRGKKSIGRQSRAIIRSSALPRANGPSPTLQDLEISSDSIANEQMKPVAPSTDQIKLVAPSSFGSRKNARVHTLESSGKSNTDVHSEDLIYLEKEVENNFPVAPYRHRLVAVRTRSKLFIADFLSRERQVARVLLSAFVLFLVFFVGTNVGNRTGGSLVDGAIDEILLLCPSAGISILVTRLQKMI